MNRRVATACLSAFRYAATTAALLLTAAPAFAQNLYVSGKVGIATNSPILPLHVATCGSGQPDCDAHDVSLTDGGFAMFGSQGSANLTFDENEIMARNNSLAAELYINKDGGKVYLTSNNGGITQVGSGNGCNTCKAPLIIEGGSDINPGDPLGEGILQVGRNSGIHLIIDGDEILTRNGMNTLVPLRLNDYVGGVVNLPGQTSTTSDASLKTDIEPIRNALEKLGALRGVAWRWKTGKEDAPRSMGVIAQEVELVFPEIVSTNPNGQKSVVYNALVGVLIAGVNELAAESTALAAERAALDHRVTDLETTLDTQIRELASENDELRQQLRAFQQRMDAFEASGGACGR